jgi:endonuclease IV
LKEFSCAGVVISESPNIEKDAILMQKYFESI